MEFEEYIDNIDVEDELRLDNVYISRARTFHGAFSKDYTNVQDKKRVRPLGTACFGVNNTHCPLESSDRFLQCWNYLDALMSIMSMKPVCYVILSKPGLHAYELGEAIAEKYKCVHIAPRKLILDEIQQNSPTGRCLDYNMRRNKVCRFDIILAMIKKIMRSELVKHRGYVISGLPILTASKELRLFIETLRSEDAVNISQEILFDIVANLKKRKKRQRMPDAESQNTSMSNEFDVEGLEQEEEEEEEDEQEEVEEEEEQIKLPEYMLDTCAEILQVKEVGFIKTTQACLLEQLKFIWELDLPPDIIIYPTNSDVNVISRKSHRYINYHKNSREIKPLLKLDIESEIRWPPKYHLGQRHVPLTEVSEFDLKYCCQQPFDFPKNSVQQLCNFRNYVLHIIEEKIKDYKPKFVIKLDGRGTVGDMMNHISEREITLSIRPVRIPFPLYLEDPSEDPGEFWDMIESSNFIQAGPIKMTRFVSPWSDLCPVELSRRHTVRGNFKYAVAFMRFVLVLSSLKNMILFIKNPRPYLKIDYLEPPCRFFILGSKLSGKTLISRCFTWLFDVPITNFNTFLTSAKQKKYHSFGNIVFSEISATIEDSRLMNWRTKEKEREEALLNFVNLNSEILEEYVSLFKIQSETIPNLKIQDEVLPKQEDKISERIIELQKQLSFIPNIDNIEECELILKNTSFLEKFAPPEMSLPVPKPAIPLYGDEDVMKAIESYIIANDMSKDAEPTVEELMNELVKILREIDKHSLEKYGVYGRYIIDDFPIQSEYWEFLVNANVLPDTTIGLIENKEIIPELLEHYKSLDVSDLKYQSTFLQAKDPLIKLKLASKPPDDLDDTLGDKYSPDLDPDEWVNMFSEEVARYIEDWETVKSILEENKKNIIEVELENKSGVHIVEEVLRKLRQMYNVPCLPNNVESEVDEVSEPDLSTYNNPVILGDTKNWCPVSLYDHGILWKGKNEFSIKHYFRTNFFGNELLKTKFEEDPTKYEKIAIPFKKVPPFRICVTGCTGSGKSSASKFLAKELGLIHVDFIEYINHYIIPKHFKKIGLRYENSFSEQNWENDMETEWNAMDEDESDFLTELMFNESELKNIIFGYIEEGSSLLSLLLHKILKNLWFKEPFLSKGFVLDGFPKMSSDIEEMVSAFCIPDIVIELQSDMDICIDRVTPSLLEIWKTQKTEARNKSKSKFITEKVNWLNFVAARFSAKMILEEVLHETFLNGIPDKVAEELIGEHVEPEAEASKENFLKKNGMNLYSELIEEFPEPERQTVWEKRNEAQTRIENRLQNIYEVEEQNIGSLEENLNEQNIEFVTVNTSKPLYKACRSILSKITKLRDRNESFFEQTMILPSPDTAAILLMQGFYFLSKFYYMCPVHIYENKISITNPYRIFKSNGDCYPVLHRCYIYYLFGKENAIKFRKNPLKYIICDNIKDFIDYPLRIAILGPPKSGKSTLATAIAKEYGLLCLSKGMGVRFMLDNMAHAIAASKMISRLREGEVVDNNLVLQAVRAASLNERTTALGLIYDGYPNIPSGGRELMCFGLYPQIIIEIKTTKERVIQNTENENYPDIIRYKPRYPTELILERYDRWHETIENLKQWVQNECQNWYTVDGSVSKWQTHQNARDLIKTIIPKVYAYLHRHDSNSVIPMDAICVFEDTFERNMSSYQHVCPLCFQNNVLSNNIYPFDKKGILLYKGKFYWFCKDHLEIGLKKPEKCFLDEEVKLPELAAKVTAIDKTFIYEKGVCLVTYAENLPSQRIVAGNLDFAATYKGKTYLFCGHDCLVKFLVKPHLYYDIMVFKDAKIFCDVSVIKLPDIGYLEQTVGKLITMACCAANALRPKYPGLDVTLSGAIFIALYLKNHNPKKGKPEIFEAYQRMLSVFEARCKLIINLGLRLRSMQNPFSTYPKCCKPQSSPSFIEYEYQADGDAQESKTSSSVLTQSPRRVPVPDERYDYLCEYHKPASKVPAFLNVVDIAGLVRGAAEGQGLGNAFLSHIKACDAIFHLCRAFDDEDVIHVDGDVNPVRDLETIAEELRLKDEEQLLQALDKLERNVTRGGDKKLKPELDALQKVKTILVDEKKHIRFGDWTAADIEVLNRYLFLTSKPALYLVNLSEKDYTRKKNKWLAKLKEWIDKNDPGAPLIPFSGVLESKLFEMPADEKQAYLKEHGITSALDKIIVQGYKALQLEYFFTAGADEVKAWTIQKGTKAPQAAGRIHTDFEKGFIMAEVMHFKDFKEEGSEAACKSAGKYRQQGRNYVVEDGDIIFFKFNAGAGLKDAKKK